MTRPLPPPATLERPPDQPGITPHTDMTKVPSSPLRGRMADGKFVKGHVANPAGRKPNALAFATAVRERVDPNELIDRALAIARGEPMVRDLQHLRAVAKARREGLPDPERPRDAEVIWPSVGEMQHAIQFLTAWGWQKPPERLELAPAAPDVDYSRLSDEELEQAERLAAKAALVIEVEAVER